MNGATVNTEQNGVADCLHLVQAEFLEMPGLQLTRSQFRRLWGLEDQTSDTVLEQLLAAHFLRQTAQGQYVLDAPPC
jgi:hypothetical protein